MQQRVPILQRASAQFELQVVAEFLLSELLNFLPTHFTEIGCFKSTKKKKIWFFSICSLRLSEYSKCLAQVEDELVDALVHAGSTFQKLVVGCRSLLFYRRAVTLCKTWLTCEVRTAKQRATLPSGLPHFQIPQVQCEMQKINMKLNLLIYRQDNCVFRGLSLGVLSESENKPVIHSIFYNRCMCFLWTRQLLRPHHPLWDAFPPNPYLLHQLLLSLLSSLLVGAVGSALGWGQPCAPQGVGCPTGAVLLGCMGQGVQGSLKISFQRLRDGQRVKQQAADGTLLFSNVTLCLQPAPQDDLFPWPPTTYCTGFLLTLPTCDVHWLSAQSSLIGVWLGFFVVGRFFTKTHCSGCVLMQADFEGLRGIRTLTCATSPLLSKPQSQEQGVFMLVCWFQTARRNRIDKKLLLLSTLIAQALTAKATAKLF